MIKINNQLFLQGVLVLIASFQIYASPASAESPPTIEIKQGETVFLKVPSATNLPVFEGKFLGKRVYFNRIDETGEYGAILGVDLDQKPSDEPVTDPVQKKTFANVHILPNQFERQELKVAPQYVNPSPKQLRRVIREKNELKAILSAGSDAKEWTGNFMVPVKGVREGRFGSRRVFNGEARNPHGGEDIAAPEKTPVYSPNDGVVVGVVDHFFSGKGIIIDHGQGLFTEYFHLFKTEVKKGERVKKGKLIGLAGHTGRATGPHLHWGTLINGARVDPFSLVKLNLE
jgi:murein DD-endopeptidase MepM/ murein hydrolase activator NlpD